MPRFFTPASVTPTIESVHEAFMRATALYRKDSDRDWRKSGGYFCLADDYGFPLVIALIGELKPAKAERYLAYCQEKARRLGQHSGHVSSWQSRNPDHDQWGGAIRLHSLIWSFSGVPELGDEAIMLAAANSLCGSSAGACALPIIEISKNPYWPGLRDALEIPC